MRTRLQGTGGVLTFRLRVFWSGVDGGAGELAQPFPFAFLFGDTLFLAFGLGDGFALAALFLVRIVVLLLPSPFAWASVWLRARLLPLGR